MSNYLSTESGGKLELVIPFKVDQIETSDIAHGLAGEGRYGNQCRRRLTVAQHSVGVYLIMRHLHPNEPMLHKAALLHDGPEAYFKDMPRPVEAAMRKMYREVAIGGLDPYAKLQLHLSWAIEERHGIDHGLCSCAAVHEADMMMFVLEWPEIMSGDAPGGEAYEEKARKLPLGLLHDIIPTARNTWPDAEARYRFWRAAEHVGLTREPLPARWQA